MAAPAPAGRFEGLTRRSEHGRRVHLMLLGPASHHAPCQHEGLREAPKRPVPGLPVPGQVAGGSGPLEMTQEAAEDRPGGDGHDVPPGALLPLRAPRHGVGQHAFAQPGPPQCAENGLAAC